MQPEESVIIGKTVQVPFNGGTLTLKKLPLGRIDELGKQSAGLVRGLASFVSGSNGDSLADQIGRTYTESPKQIAALAATLTGLEAQVFLDAEDPDEVLEIVGEGCRLNNVMGLFGNALKKVTGAERARTSPQA
jgi:hypothetical protein